MRKNILIINLKGGASKTTNASILASYLPEATLIEIDKINQSDTRINSLGYYNSVQIDFNNETSEKFFDFENLLIGDGIKIIDVGAVKLEIFHNAMETAALYDLIDLLIIPCMDGRDDFLVALDYLETIKGQIPAKKIMFSFNRYNDHEYDNVKEQFDNFFVNNSLIKKNFSIDLENEKNFYVLKDSKAVKNARKLGVTVRSLAEKDVQDITQRQRAEMDAEKRLELTKERSLVLNAQKFYNDFIIPMIEKIGSKLN